MLKNMKKSLPIIKDDPWLQPFAPAIEGRHEDALKKMKELAGKGKLCDFANAYNYYGLHRTDNGWTFREWAPNATDIYIVGPFNEWTECEPYRMKRLTDGNWEINLPERAMAHGDLFKLHVHWNGGWGERIPAYATRVVQDDTTKIFSAQVWSPEKPYEFKVHDFVPTVDPLLIYECHIGMAQNKEAVGSYEEFRTEVLPRIVKLGYNAIQIMAIQEHPYYGSFGYHVSSFYAASSRFGTPEELKHLIDEAHAHGLAVIMDIVHSHAVKNEVEGLGRFDGSYDQYFYGDGRREHPAWDSLCFDYGKNAVINFLLSNCKFWLDEYKFDGFRFDGVTSMIYQNHGLGENFTDYSQYFGLNTNVDALTYLQLANELIHEVNPFAVTIAEDMSGMPGMALPIRSGGIGFDYRLSMGIPDFWIRLLKDVPDRQWDMGRLWYELTTRRPQEKNVGYCESHDQALVGDKTLIFRMADAEMYTGMDKAYHSLAIDRAIALHKMIRFITLALGSEAYLNFMGNEFGHPEWIDFPREGNGWSHHYARRQWSLAENGYLKYEWLERFDREMLKFARKYRVMTKPAAANLWMDEKNKLLAFAKGDLIYLFNFSPDASPTDFFVPAHITGEGQYRAVFTTDRIEFGGQDRVSERYVYTAKPVPDKGVGFTVYLPSRTAIVFRRVD